MKKTLTLHAMALAALLAASSAALASMPIQGPGAVTLTNTTGITWTAAIGDTPMLGAFTDVFTFTPIATPGSLAWATVTNTSFMGIGGIVFTSADLNGTPLIVGAAAPPVIHSGAALVASPVMGPLTLTVHGINAGGGSYGGDFTMNLAAVPEPATYGMLLAGSGILAMLARRRRQG